MPSLARLRGWRPGWENGARGGWPAAPRSGSFWPRVIRSRRRSCGGVARGITFNASAGKLLLVGRGT
eukprot:1543920-Lingulodinium_polyedra.AAC.1